MFLEFINITEISGLIALFTYLLPFFGNNTRAGWENRGRRTEEAEGESEEDIEEAL